MLPFIPDLGDVLGLIFMEPRPRFMMEVGDKKLLEKDLIRWGTDCSLGPCMDVDNPFLSAKMGDSSISAGMESADRLFFCLVLVPFLVLRCS